MPTAKKYLHQLGLSLGLTLLLVGLCNALVDPYDVYGAPRIPGFNAVKVSYEDRLHKAAMLSRKRPDAVILGSSRVQYGIDPEDPVLRALARRIYNVGLLGAGPYQLRRYLEHAHALTPLEVAVLGLDFLMWSDHIERVGYARSFHEARLAVDESGRPSATWPASDLAPTLFSLDALRMSFATIRKQHSAVDELLPSGMRNPRDIERRIREHGGARAHFLHSERMYVEQYRHYELRDEQGRSRATDELARILAFTRRHGIRTILFLTPNHARLAQLELAMGLGAEIEAWKRTITRQVALENLLRPPEQQVSLLDLSTPLPHSEEPLPAALDHDARTRWFSDSGHGTTALGHEIAAVLAGQKPEAEVFAAGGTLTPATIEPVLARVREAQRRYAERHPADIAEIEALLSEHARNLHGGD